MCNVTLVGRGGVSTYRAENPVCLRPCSTCNAAWNWDEVCLSPHKCLAYTVNGDLPAATQDKRSDTMRSNV